MLIFTETDNVAMMSSVSLTLTVKNESSPDIPLSYTLPSPTGLNNDNHRSLTGGPFQICPSSLACS